MDSQFTVESLVEHSWKESVEFGLVICMSLANGRNFGQETAEVVLRVDFRNRYPNLFKALHPQSSVSVGAARGRASDLLQPLLCQ
jgi:hypothetical protein